MESFRVFLPEQISAEKTASLWFAADVNPETYKKEVVQHIVYERLLERKHALPLTQDSLEFDNEVMERAADYIEIITMKIDDAVSVGNRKIDLLLPIFAHEARLVSRSLDVAAVALRSLGYEPSRENGRLQHDQQDLAIGNDAANYEGLSLKLW